MATKLNQIIAVEKTVKARSEGELTAVYHQLQKPEPLSGIARSYRPRDDEGERLPSESTRVQVRVEDQLQKAGEALTDLFDVTATKDWGNCGACADVTVDGRVLLHDVPATFLLFLEKKLVDLRTLVQKLPTLDPSEAWRFDANQDCWASDAKETTKTKKIPRNHVKAEATDKHPAQVEVYHEDVVVGLWTTTRFSGALPVARQTELLRRVEKLQQAVKFAREQANALEVEPRKVGADFFGYLFAR